MLLDVQALKDGISEGAVLPRRLYDEKRWYIDIMEALTGVEMFLAKEHHEVGWPKWLAELAVFIFEEARETWKEDSIHFAEAVERAKDRDLDLYEGGAVWRSFRASVLDIAMKSIGDRDEPWRVKAREAVQWSIDRDGEGNSRAEKALAIIRREAEITPGKTLKEKITTPAAYAVLAAMSDRSAGGSNACVAAVAAGATIADSHRQIFDAFIAALEEPKA
ncbi:MAG: hypothetical protein AAGE80_05500 [Pseudomonadota bacterium]